MPNAPQRQTRSGTRIHETQGGAIVAPKARRNAQKRDHPRPRDGAVHAGAPRANRSSSDRDANAAKRIDQPQTNPVRSRRGPGRTSKPRPNPIRSEGVADRSTRRNRARTRSVPIATRTPPHVEAEPRLIRGDRGAHPPAGADRVRPDQHAIGSPTHQRVQTEIGPINLRSERGPVRAPGVPVDRSTSNRKSRKNQPSNVPNRIPFDQGCELDLDGVGVRADRFLQDDSRINAPDSRLTGSARASRDPLDDARKADRRENGIDAGRGLEPPSRSRFPTSIRGSRHEPKRQNRDRRAPEAHDEFRRSTEYQAPHQRRGSNSAERSPRRDLPRRVHNQTLERSAEPDHGTSLGRRSEQPPHADRHERAIQDALQSADHSDKNVRRTKRWKTPIDTIRSNR